MVDDVPLQVTGALAEGKAALPVLWTYEAARPAGTRRGDRVPLTDPTAAYLGTLSSKGRRTMAERLAQ